jgi:hypothetical protein
MPLSKAQQTIADSDKRFIVGICGRRFGKTFLAMNRICYHARIPKQEVWAVFPTYRQAKSVLWKKLKYKLLDLRWVDKINESELSIQLKNGSMIYLKGADNPDSLRGNSINYLVCDEFSQIEPAAWYEVLRPMLADTQGKAMFISTPQGSANWAYDLYMMENSQPGVWASFTYSTLDGGNVTEEEVESARRDLDERTFRQEFLATWEQYAGRIYYAFEPKLNTQAPTSIDLSVLYVGMDHNIDPMTAVIAIRQGEVLYVIDEIRMFSSNTQEAVDEIKSRYPRSKIWCFSDPAGHARKTSAGGLTDVIILQNAGFVVKTPRHHTPVRDRINAVNARLCNTRGVRQLFVHPKCKYTIQGLERHTYKEGTSTPEKGGDPDYSHQMDSLGYLVDYLFPIKKDTSQITQPRRWTHNTGV